MLNTIFGGIFDTQSTTVISVWKFLLCVGVALVIGVILAAVYSYKNRYTKSFLVTLAILPAIVCVVIMMVNGNVGAGVAVAGAFSLVRFRSVPGTAKEIGAIFLAMAAGLIAGMGYLGYAVLFTVVLCGCMLLYNKLSFGSRKNVPETKVLHITIPAILPTIVILLILDLSSLFSANFDQIYNLYNNYVLSTGDVLSTYIYRISLGGGTSFELSTAINLVLQVLGLIVVLITNKFVSKLDIMGIF